MGVRISYIIPTLNEERALAATLGSVLAQPGEKEIIVADGGSVDRTLAIGRQHGCLVTEGPPGRGAQLNRGADLATGGVFLFLHADTILPEGASADALKLLESPGVIAGSFRLKFQPSSVLLDLFSMGASANHSLFTYGDQGLFISRSAFFAMGAFKPYPFLEDVDFQIRLRRHGRFAKSKLAVTTSSRRFLTHGILCQQLRNLCIVAAYHAGVPPQTLARFYKSNR